MLINYLLILKNVKLVRCVHFTYHLRYASSKNTFAQTVNNIIKGLGYNGKIWRDYTVASVLTLPSYTLHKVLLLKYFT